MKNFSIIIPTLNEADNILLLLQRISGVFQPLELQPEILIVDDGSTDGTRDLVAAYHGDLSVRLICRDSIQGLASAVIAGALAASHEHLVVMDADLSHPPEIIPQLIAPLLAETHDMVIGSRYTVGGSTPNWPAFRRIGSQLASIPALLLTHVRDPLSGFFSINRKWIRLVDENLAGFKIALEILAGTGDSLRVLEVPISFRDRFRGYSKMKPKVFQEYLYQLGRLSSEYRVVKFFPLLLLLGLSVGLVDGRAFSFLAELGWGSEVSHILSYLAAMHVGYPLSLLVRWQKRPEAIVNNYLHFLTIILLGLFLRGGLLALPAFAGGAYSSLLSVSAVASDTLIWLTVVIIDRADVFRPQSVHWRSFGIFLIGYTVLLRLFYLGNIELIQEEAYYWNYAQHLAPGYLDHPPVIALLIRFGTRLFGNDEFGVRFGAFTCWFITGFFAYNLAKRMFNSTTAFRALILVAALPIFFGVGLLSTPDAPLIACWSASLYFLYRALVQDDSRSWYWAGLSLGIGLASKYTIATLGPAVILFMLADPWARKWFFRPQPYVSALLALAVFSPVLWWNYENSWASFLFQTQKRMLEVSHFSTPMLLLSILLLLTPTGFLGAVTSLLPKTADNGAENSASSKMYRGGYLFCLTMALVPLSVFVVFSFTKEIKLNWTGPLWLSLVPFIAGSMIQSRGGLQKWIAKLWPQTLVVTICGYGALLYYCAFGLPATPFASNVFLYGWDDLARQVNKLTHGPGNRQPLLVVGMDKYRTASGLAFYLRKIDAAKQSNSDLTEVTGGQLFGYDSLMYNFWYPPSLAQTRDILVISKSKEQLNSAIFVNRCQHFGRIKELDIKKRGKPSGHYFYRILTSYTTSNGVVSTRG